MDVKLPSIQILRCVGELVITLISTLLCIRRERETTTLPPPTVEQEHLQLLFVILLLFMERFVAISPTETMITSNITDNRPQ